MKIKKGPKKDQKVEYTEIVVNKETKDRIDDEYKKRLVCSFCGTSQTATAKLIAGPNVYICQDCVALCVDIIMQEKGTPIVSDQVVELSLQYLKTIDETLNSIREDLAQKRLPSKLKTKESPYVVKSAIQEAFFAVN